jgi:hypothetical protein
VSDAGADNAALLDAVTALRAEVAASSLPLRLAQTQTASAHRTALLNQLDDYVIPRLSSLDAPLLAVIGGSTGAGKSTLVNSLVAADVSRSGILRPTTTSPVLVHHPAESAFFVGDRILPGLNRVTGAGSADGNDGPGTVRLVASASLPPGMALLDAPDIDSVVSANRALAAQLLSAADLWLFVTTAARYADAVPWELLRQASDRGTAVAIVLDRVPPEAMTEIRSHLASMLREQGLSTAPIFAIPETKLTPAGRLPEEHTVRLKSWLTALASDARARASVVRQTLTGALDSLDSRTAELVEASMAQDEATSALRAASEQAYSDALRSVESGMTDGTLLRGEVLARWQEYVGTGEFFRQVESTISRIRDRITSAVKGDPAPSSDLGEALQTGVAALVSAHSQAAASAGARAWRALPGGAELIAAHPELAKPSPGLDPAIARMVRDWQGGVLELVRSEGRDRRTTARIAAYGVNAIGVILMLVAFAHTGGLVGAEVGIAGGTAVLAQKVLEAIFGDQAVREMAAKARAQLLDQVEELYAGERARFEAAIQGVEIKDGQAVRLADAAAAVKAVR